MASDVVTERHGDFEIAVGRGVDGFLAWGKMGRIQTTCPVLEPGNHVFVNFGTSREEARDRLLSELGLIS